VAYSGRASRDDDYHVESACPAVFVAGEMIDWEAPTGGYLLTACFATGRRGGARGIGKPGLSCGAAGAAPQAKIYSALVMRTMVEEPASRFSVTA
jgi:hypothetical protein